jgi:hypothetical protein
MSLLFSPAQWQVVNNSSIQDNQFCSPQPQSTSPVQRQPPRLSSPTRLALHLSNVSLQSLNAYQPPSIRADAA